MKWARVLYNWFNPMATLIKKIGSVAIFILCLFQFPFCKKGQSQDPGIALTNPAFSQKLNTMLSFSTPVLSVDALAAQHDQIFLIDTRERNEFEVSHIPGAHYGGYKNFDLQQFLHLPRDTTLVFYCSVGYRSEKIAEKMKKAGFVNVFNLYGSIFEWVNSGNTVVDMAGNKSDRLHTYNRKWGQWVDGTKIKKVH